MVTSGGCCRTGEVEGVGTVELVCVGGLLRMGGESLLLPVWGSVGGGFNGQVELDAWVFWAVTWWPGNLYGMGAGWSGTGVNSTKSIWHSPPGGWIRLNVGAWWGRENCLV